MIILMKIKKNIIQSDCIFWSSIQNINSRMFWVGLGKTNALFNLINNQPDLYGAKYQYLINKREKVGLNHYDGPKAFIGYSNDMQDVYRNIEEHNPGKKRKVLIVSDSINDC